MAHVDDEEAITILEPHVADAIGRVVGNRFSTKALIEALRAGEAGGRAYEQAIASIRDEAGSEHMAKLVIHGQVIPGLLRRSPMVRFAGFIPGNPDEDDGFAVPSWWRKV
ncbi:MAG TPA: hypothetical protein VFC51_01500 [Chloroflexota bacterium]|nr:hypothetical protein [Chloroflexota bacterium]